MPLCGSIYLCLICSLQFTVVSLHYRVAIQPVSYRFITSDSVGVLPMWLLNRRVFYMNDGGENCGFSVRCVRD